MEWETILTTPTPKTKKNNRLGGEGMTSRTLDDEHYTDPTSQNTTQFCKLGKAAHLPVISGGGRSVRRSRFSWLHIMLEAILLCVKLCLNKPKPEIVKGSLTIHG